METIQKLGLATLFAVSTALNAQAVLITPATTPQFTGSNQAILTAAEVQAATGSSLTLTLQYAVETQFNGSPPPGTDTGPFATSYLTTYGDFKAPPNEPMDALITYVGGPFITGSEIYLYVKDVQATPAFYIFDIRSWNGTDPLVLDNFWPGPAGVTGGSIAHIEIFSGNRVPDSGATLTLFGFALGAIEIIRRRFAT